MSQDIDHLVYYAYRLRGSNPSRYASFSPFLSRSAATSGLYDYLADDTALALNPGEGYRSRRKRARELAKVAARQDWELVKFSLVSFCDPETVKANG